MLKKIYHLIFAGLLLIFLYGVYEAIRLEYRLNRISGVFLDSLGNARVLGSFFYEGKKCISTWVIFFPPDKNIKLANEYISSSAGWMMITAGLTGNTLVLYTINDVAPRMIEFSGIVSFDNEGRFNGIPQLKFDLDDSYLYLVEWNKLTRIKLPDWIGYQEGRRILPDEQKQRIIDYLLNEQQLAEPWRALFTKNAPQETQE